MMYVTSLLAVVLHVGIGLMRWHLLLSTEVVKPTFFYIILLMARAEGARCGDKCIGLTCNKAELGTSHLLCNFV